MDADKRNELAEAIKARRKAIYGTKVAAYTEAKVNAATWDRAEAGESIREDRLTAIIKTLWPRSEGDPEKISGAPTDWPEYPDMGAPTWDDLASGEREERLMAWIADNFVRINGRLADLESAISERSVSSDPRGNVRALRDEPSAANPERRDSGIGDEHAT